MPIPKPGADETLFEFVLRCDHHPTMGVEFKSETARRMVSESMFANFDPSQERDDSGKWTDGGGGGSGGGKTERHLSSAPLRSGASESEKKAYEQNKKRRWKKVSLDMAEAMLKKKGYKTKGSRYDPDRKKTIFKVEHGATGKTEEMTADDMYELVKELV